MKTTLYHQTVPKPDQRRISALSTRARPRLPPSVPNPRLVALRKWVDARSHRVSTPGYVVGGLLILGASLIAVRLADGREMWWRFGTCLGAAMLIIGLLHKWLDARAARNPSLLSSRKRSGGRLRAADHEAQRETELCAKSCREDLHRSHDNDTNRQFRAADSQEGAARRE